MELYRKSLVFLLLSLFGLFLPAYGQSFRFGGMVAGQDQVIDVASPAVVSPNNFSFGPSAGVRLPLHLSIEVNMLPKAA